MNTFLYLQPSAPTLILLPHHDLLLGKIPGDVVFHIVHFPVLHLLVHHHLSNIQQPLWILLSLQPPAPTRIPPITSLVTSSFTLCTSPSLTFCIYFFNTTYSSSNISPTGNNLYQHYCHHRHQIWPWILLLTMSLSTLATSLMTLSFTLCTS